MILRGGRSGPNYSSSHVTKALDLITAAGLPRRIMVDASHGNSGKDHTRQLGVAESLAEQLAGGEHGLAGVMLESFLVAGRQNPGDPATLTYGQSVTDACMDIEMTEAALATLAVLGRRPPYRLLAVIGSASAAEFGQLNRSVRPWWLKRPVVAQGARVSPRVGLPLPLSSITRRRLPGA